MAQTTECFSRWDWRTLICPKVAERTVLESKWSDSSSVKAQVVFYRVWRALTFSTQFRLKDRALWKSSIYLWKLLNIPQRLSLKDIGTENMLIICYWDDKGEINPSPHAQRIVFLNEFLKEAPTFSGVVVSECFSAEGLSAGSVLSQLETRRHGIRPRHRGHRALYWYLSHRLLKMAEETASKCFSSLCSPTCCKNMQQTSQPLL